MSFDNLVFGRADQFADFVKEQPEVGSYVHIRIQQRNGRKSLTTVQGLAEDLDLKKILKALKKMFSTNGTIVADEEMGDVIQLQGDQRKNVAEFLVKYKICSKIEVKIHGF
jgi:translation initiation factor 1